MDRSPSDEELLADFLRGREEMFEPLVRRYEGPLFAFIFRITGNEADAADLFQETFLRVYRHRKSYTGRGNFRSWLYAIATNVCRSRLRKRELPRSGEAADCDRENGGPSPPQVTEAREVGEQVAVLVNDLPEDQREVLVLKIYEDLTYTEIAETLDRPIGTVKSQMRYALQKLRGPLRRLIDAGEPK